MKVLIWLCAAFVFSLGSTAAAYATDPATASMCVILVGMLAFWFARTLCKTLDKNKNAKNSGSNALFTSYSSDPVYFSDNILPSSVINTQNISLDAPRNDEESVNNAEALHSSPKIHKTVPLYFFVISCFLVVVSLSLFSWQMFDRQKLQEQIATLTTENSILSQNTNSLLKSCSTLRQKNAIFSNKVSQLEMQNSSLSQSNKELTKTVTYFTKRIVFIYNDGKAYHSYNCSFIDDKFVIPMTFLNVANSDYVPCPLCSARTYDNVSITNLLLESPFDLTP